MTIFFDLVRGDDCYRRRSLADPLPVFGGRLDVWNFPFDQFFKIDLGGVGRFSGGSMSLSGLVEARQGHNQKAKTSAFKHLNYCNDNECDSFFDDGPTAIGKHFGMGSHSMRPCMTSDFLDLRSAYQAVFMGQS